MSIIVPRAAVVSSCISPFGTDMLMLAFTLAVEDYCGWKIGSHFAGPGEGVLGEPVGDEARPVTGL